jgi:hypothetical protein
MSLPRNHDVHPRDEMNISGIECPRQCLGSGSAFDGLLDLNPHCDCGSGSRRGKNQPENEEKLSLKTRKNMEIIIFYALQSYRYLRQRTWS